MYFGDYRDKASTALINFISQQSRPCLLSEYSLYLFVYQIVQVLIIQACF